MENALCASDAACPQTRQLQIQQLNDRLRATGQGGRVMLTNGITDLPGTTIADIVAAVASFTDFTPDNDPYGEHDCAVLEIGGRRIIWKIDYYDRSLSFHSENPADPAVTTRVLTIMLAEEY